jgi:biotin carboxyl carrier protein
VIFEAMKMEIAAEAPADAPTFKLARLLTQQRVMVDPGDLLALLVPGK